MEGVDPAPQEAGIERSAVYHQLPPGRHRFRVTAANSLGIWNQEGATLAVTVLPAWWQRVWVHAAGWMVLIGAAILFYRKRVQQLERRRALQEDFSRQVLHSQEAERKRIASELHDGLGQNLLVAKNLALLGTLKPPSAAEVEPRFKEIADVLGATLSDVRSISHALRPAELDQLGLSKALKLMLERLHSSTGIAVEAQVLEVDHLLRGDDSIHCYRLMQEGLNNVMRHAQATRLQCRITPTADGIEAMICDNGHGFDLTRVEQQGRLGLGLQGMKERARLMGGRMEIESAPGRGTRLCLRLSLSGKSDD
jgi:signal transduction histidine kinase